ncbi:MAG: RES domain-containing protein, partial [Zavarzinella sp.]|nr:RES domain-containing protein [Zavarzinella sp.]
WVPGRFNAGRPGRPGFPVLYLAEDNVTPLFEVGALVGSPLPGGVVLPVPGAVWRIVHVTVAASAVVDLTNPATLSLLGASIQELTGDWRGYTYRPGPPAGPPYWTRVPTQQLGHALAAVPGVEGWITYSARFPTRRNLVLLRNNLLPTSSVSGIDPATGTAITMP